MRTVMLLLALVLYAAPGEYSTVERDGRFWLQDPAGRISFYSLSSCTEVGLPQHVDPFGGLPRVDAKAGPVCWTPPADTAAWVSAVRRSGSETEGKQMYVSFLKERYAYNIGRVNEAYGLEASAFTDLAESDFRSLDARRPAVADDDREFGQLLVTQCASLLRKQIARSVLFLIRASSDSLAPYATALIVDESEKTWPGAPVLVRVSQGGDALAERIVRNPYVIGVEGPESFANLIKERLRNAAGR